jgi:alkylation response protein AidB-like acyl-CoA dehydrogenase
VPVDRLLPTPEAHDVIDLVRQVADKAIDPIVDLHERQYTYPDGLFKTLGDAGLLSLRQPIGRGGGGQPFEVYLQVLEELAVRWAAVAVAVSVLSLACHPLLTYGSEEQCRKWLPDMLGGALIGTYGLSEPDAGMPYSRGASVAKLVATDAAMKVTTDAVQVLGGYGCTRDYWVERYMHEAKITQIFVGTN